MSRSTRLSRFSHSSGVSTCCTTFLGLAGAALLLGGCGVGGSGGSAAPVPVHPAISISGTIYGGQQPISGSSIAMYAAGKLGTASAPRSMLTSPVTSDSGGNFSITGLYSCQTGDQVYLVATGGDAGSGINGAISMMTALGPCSTVLANAKTIFVTINEVTTVGSVYALAAYMNGVQALGSLADPISTNGLAAAFANTGTMVNISTGAAPAISTGNGIVPQTTINSLANSIAACINSAAATSSNCAALFRATAVGGNTPADTLQAVLNVARNPNNNPAGIFSVNPSGGPFQPSPNSAPASYAIVVAHPSDVLTYHNDISRDGAQTAEGVLNPTNVKSPAFGKLFSYNVDSYLFAQPLYAGGIGMPDGLVHNVVIAASTHGTVYAFDADGNNASSGYQLWSVSLVPSGERYPTGADYGCNNPPEAGIVGTPVVDRASGTIYVVVKTTSGGAFYQRLHAISLIDGSERSGSPTLIAPSFKGGGGGSVGGTIAFDSQRQLERSALLLTTNAGGGKTVWVSFASHCDIPHYHGIVLGFDGTSLATTASYIDTPNGEDGGIWMNSGGLAADAQGYVYALTGNGTFDVDTNGTDFGDAALKLQPPAVGGASTLMTVYDYFVPADQAYLNDHDLDVGGAEAILINDPASGVAPHPMIASDKNGSVYLINTSNMDGYEQGPLKTNGDIQDFSAGNVFIYNFAFFNNVLYTSTPLKAYAFNPGTASTAGSLTTTPFAQPGISQTAPVVSANGTSNVVVWTQETGGKMHAYTSDLTEIYNTGQVAGDAPATFVKFTSPVIANGKVYLSGQGSLVVYGIK